MRRVLAPASGRIRRARAAWSLAVPVLTLACSVLFPEPDPPIVTITNPSPGDTIRAAVELAAKVESGSAIRRLAFYIDGQELGRDTSAPFNWHWEAVYWADGAAHTVAAVAESHAGVTGSTKLSVVVSRGAAGAPILVNPPDGSTHARTDRIGLVWREFPDAEEYRIELTQDPTFSDVAFRITTSHTAISTPPLSPAEWHWRVRARHRLGGWTMPSRSRWFDLAPLYFDATFGSPGVGYAVVEASDGDFVVAGRVGGRAHVLRIDANGVLEWEAGLRGAGENTATSVAATPDDGFVVAGWGQSVMPDPPYDYWYGILSMLDGMGGRLWSASSDPSEYSQVVATRDGGLAVIAGSDVLMTMDAEGTPVWTTQLGMSAYGLETTDDGGYVVVGRQDLGLVARISATGDSLWTKVLGDVGSPQSVVQAASGGYAVCGGSWLIKTNELGDVAWERTYPNVLGLRRVRQTPDGGYILAGRARVAPLNEDGWLIKTDAGGAVEWERGYGGPSSDAFYDVQCTRDGGFVMVGYSSTRSQRYVWVARTRSVTSNGNSPPAPHSPDSRAVRD